MAASTPKRCARRPWTSTLPEGGTMLGFGVKFEGAGIARSPARTTRAFPVIIQYIDGKAGRRVAKEPGAARAGAAAAGRNDLQLQVGGAGASVRAGRCSSSRGLVKRFRRLHGRQQRVVQGRSGRDTRPDRPQRLGQEHDLQHAVGHVPAVGGLDQVGGRTRLAGLAPHRIINRGIGRTFQIPRPFRRLSIFENVALAGYFGQGRHSLEKGRRSGGTCARAWSACRPTERRASTGWAPPA